MRSPRTIGFVLRDRDGERHFFADQPEPARQPTAAQLSATLAELLADRERLDQHLRAEADRAGTTYAEALVETIAFARAINEAAALERQRSTDPERLRLHLRALDLCRSEEMDYGDAIERVMKEGG